MSEPLFRPSSPADPRDEALDLLAADNHEFRERLLQVEPVATTGDRATFAAWEKEQAIFSVPHRGRRFIFAYQFENGRPHPSIKAVLTALPASFSAWQRAAWFVSTNGWLDDDAPRDRLDDIEALVFAARHEAEDPIG